MDAWILRAGLDRVDKFTLHGARNRVAAFGAIERDAHDAVDLLDQ